MARPDTRTALARALHDPTFPAWSRVEALVGVLVVLSVGLTVIEVVFEIPRGWRRPFNWLDRGLLLLFAVELSLRVATYRPPQLDLFRMTPAGRLRTHVFGRLRFLFTPMMLIDLVTVVALVPALRGLRALRILRLARQVRFFRYTNPFHQVQAALQDNALLFVFALGLLAAETIVGGITMYLIEGPRNPAVQTVWDGMWWTLVTLTTVGYGDITPVEDMGRIWAATLMVAGMFTLALFAGVVGHTLLTTVLTIREEQFRMNRFANHVVILGYEPESRVLLDALTAELGGGSTEVVLMGQGERPHGVPPAFRWVSGDPQHQGELDKVHLSHATSLLFVGRRSVSPQQADAATILGIFTARAFMAAKDTAHPREAPLQVVAEILEPENVAHAKVAGADEVIESTRLGFALLAHTVAQPGTAVVASRVVSAGHHSIYVADADAFGGQPMGDVARAVKEAGGLLLGFRCGVDGEEVLNPADDVVLGPDHQLLYLATKPVLQDSRPA